MIYLDYSANTPVDPAVLDAFCRTEQTYIGNPNSAHPAGRAAQAEMARATEGIAALQKEIATLQQNKHSDRKHVIRIIHALSCCGSTSSSTQPAGGRPRRPFDAQTRCVARRRWNKARANSKDVYPWTRPNSDVIDRP